MTHGWKWKDHIKREGTRYAGDLSVQGQKDGKMRSASPASHGHPNMFPEKCPPQ